MDDIWINKLWSCTDAAIINTAVVSTNISHDGNSLNPGCKHISAAHKNVLEEMVLVIEGTLTLKVEKEIYEIKAGNSLKFDGSLNHTYMNKGNEKVAFHNIEIYK